MAKYYQRYAQGRGRVGNPDLYAELRAFGRQNQDIVNAAKEHDLRIQQRNDAWDASQKGVESNALENRRELQEFENQKFNTRKDAIQKRRDTEVDRLRGEAKIAERRASDWQALTPKLAKAVTDVATTGYQLADLHYGTKDYNEEDAAGNIDAIYQSQIFKDDEGLVSLEASKIKLEAMRKNDPEAFKWVKDRLNFSWAKSQSLTMADIRETFDQAAALFKRDIVNSGFKYDETSIDEIWDLRAGEMIAKAGFDKNSKEAIEIRKKFRKIAHDEKFGYVTKKDEEKRVTDQKDNIKWFTNNPKGEAGNERLNNLIMDGMEVNWRYNAKTGKYDLKPIDEQLKLHDRVQTVGGILVIHDRYQKIGGRRGLQLFREEFYERKLPHKQGETAEYNHEKFPEDWEIYEKAYWEEQKRRNSNRESARQSDGQATIAMIDRITNSVPHDGLLEGEEYIDPTDTSEGGGFDKIIEIANNAPTTEARDHAFSKINYTYNKSAKYSLERHRDLAEADFSGDPAGYMFLVNQIKHKETRQRYAAKYENAAIYRDADRTFETDEAWAKGQVEQKTGSNSSLGKTQMKDNHSAMVDELRTYLQWYKTNSVNKKRLKDEFGGDVRDYNDAMEREVSLEFQDKNSKKFPVIQLGSKNSLLGQQEILFPQHLSSYVNEKHKPKTMADYKELLKYSDQTDASDYRNIQTKSLPNIGDLIKSGNLLTDDETNSIARAIEMGGGAGNYINIKSEIQELADMHPHWTARDMINEHFKVKGYIHRLPPDRHTLLRWGGYEGKKPKERNVAGIEFFRNVINAFEGKMPEDASAAKGDIRWKIPMAEPLKDEDGRNVTPYPDYLLGDFDRLLNRNTTYVPGVGSIGGIL